jgi:hypothetical protein
MQIVVNTEVHLWGSAAGEYLEPEPPIGAPGSGVNDPVEPKKDFVDCACDDPNNPAEDRHGCDGQKDPDAHCMGDRSEDTDESRAGRGYVSGGNRHRDIRTRCLYLGFDNPHQLFGHKLDHTISYHWNWVSLGLIIDTCNDWIIKRLCKFTRDDIGTFDTQVKHHGNPTASAFCFNAGNPSAPTSLIAYAQDIVNRFRDRRAEKGKK